MSQSPVPPTPTHGIPRPSPGPRAPSPPLSGIPRPKTKSSPPSPRKAERSIAAFAFALETKTFRQFGVYRRKTESDTNSAGPSALNPKVLEPLNYIESWEGCIKQSRAP